MTLYLSFSGGKDSIVLADLTYKLIQAGEINPSQLTVLFVDEEAIFDSIEATTKAWRKKFLLAGAKFQWWCIEVKHFSCLNELSSDETFVCWDRRKRDVWVRQPPPFAIRNHPQLRPRIDNYQSFLPRVTMDGIMITGVRAAESIQRLQYMAALNMGAKGITGTNTIYPIYDWKTADVWLYLRDQRIEVPEVYLQMYQVGVNRNQLRVSQFFSVDTVPVLVHLGEYDPSLMERVLRREPNAYLAMLYWDSEMFHRTTRKRRELEGEDTKDYRALLKEMLFVRPGDFFNTEHKRKIAKQYYPSISGRRLIWALARKIKDKRFLRAVYSIIESCGGGLAIGYYICQWLANFYLEPLDRYIMTLPGVKYMTRYMDNITLLGPNKKQLHKARKMIAAFMQRQLGLSMKANWQI